MYEILKLDLFKQNFAMRLRTVWGAHTQKIRTQIEVLDRKISRFRPDTVGGQDWKKKNMAKSERMALLNMDTFKSFYCCIDSPRCRTNPNHFVTKL